MSDKLEQSITAQKSQLADLLAQKEQAETLLKNLNDSIPQVKGAIQALEYVKTLGLVEPPKEATKELKAVK